MDHLQVPGNNLPVQDCLDEIASPATDSDVSRADALQKRRASASVNQIQDLFSALQGLVPGQSRSQTSSPCSIIPEIIGTRLAQRLALGSPESFSDTPSYGDGMRRRNSSPRVRRRQSPSPQQTLRQLPDTPQTASKCLVTKSKSCHTLTMPVSPKASRRRTSPCTGQYSPVDATPKGPSLINKQETAEDTDIQQSESIPMLAPELGLERDLDYLCKDKSKTSYAIPRRGSLGDILEKREHLKSQASTSRRQSIGGSLLLNAIVNSAASSPRRDSLANALNLIAHKEKLQELIKTCEEKVQKEKECQNDTEFDETDAMQEPKGSSSSNQQESVEIQNQMEMLLSSISELQQDVEDYPLDQESMLLPDFTRRASVGTEMQDLLAALRDLTVTGNETPLSMSPSISPSSSIIEASRPSNKESLDELEAYFMEKLQDISKEDPKDGLTSAEVIEKRSDSPSHNVEKDRSRQSSARALENDNLADAQGKLLKFSSSAPKSVYGVVNVVVSDSNMTDPQQVKVPKRKQSPKLKPKLNARLNSKSLGMETKFKHEFVGPQKHDTPSRSDSDANLQTHSLKTISPLDLATTSSDHRTQEDSYTSVDVEPRSSQEQSDLARSRALWKQDQEIFAKQVNTKLQEWLSRATALSVQAEREEVEDVANELVANSNSDIKTTVSGNQKSVNAYDLHQPKSQSKFSFKMSMKGGAKRSKSLHSVLHPEAIKIRIQAKSPTLRTPQAFRSFSRLRLPRSKSLHNVSKKVSSPDTADAPVVSLDHKTGNSPKTIPCKVKPIQKSQMIVNSSSKKDKGMGIERLQEQIRGPTIKRTLSDRNMRYLCEESTPSERHQSSKSPVTSKRNSRLPLDLPLFYTPGEVAPRLRVSKDDKSFHNSTVATENSKVMPSLRKGLFPGFGKRSGKLGSENNKSATDRACGNPVLERVPSLLTHSRSKLESSRAKHLLAVPVGADQSFRSSYSDGMVEFVYREEYHDETRRIRRCLSQDGRLHDFDEFQDCRDGTRSESDDSGCPGNEIIICESGFQTEPVGVLHNVQETNGTSTILAADERFPGGRIQSFYDLDSETFEI